MLVISKSSRCDVCLEYYGSDSNTHPCVIPCGHTFCRRCISNLSSVTCPLCRQHYDPRTPRRLVVDVEDPSLSNGEARSPTVGKELPDPVNEEADRLQCRFTDVVTHGSTEPTLRALINDCSAFLRLHPNRFPQLRFSMRTISYLADTRTKSRSQASTITSLAAEVSTLRGDLDLQKEDFEKQMKELTERAAAEAEALQKERDNMSEQHEATTNEFKKLKLEYARLASTSRRLAHLAGQPCPEFIPVDVEMEPEEEQEDKHPRQPLVEEEFSPLPSGDVSPLCENILSPMPDIPSLSSLSFSESAPSSPYLDDAHSTSTMEDPPLLTPQHEESTFAFVPASPAIDLRSHPTSRLRGYSFASDNASDPILPPLADPIPEASSPVPPSSIPRPTQSGLSLTAPSRRRSSHNNPSPPRVGSYYDDGPSKSPKDLNLSRLHDLLNHSTNPTTSSSLPVLQGSHLSRRSSRREIPRAIPSRRHSPSRDPREDAPIASPPSSNKVSSASQAALMLEAKKEKERQRAERHERERLVDHYARDLPINPNRLSRGSIEFDYSPMGSASSSLPSSSSLSRMGSFSGKSPRTGMSSSSNYATLGFKKSNQGLRDDHHKYSNENGKPRSTSNNIGLQATHI